MRFCYILCVRRQIINHISYSLHFSFNMAAGRNNYQIVMDCNTILITFTFTTDNLCDSSFFFFFFFLTQLTSHDIFGFMPSWLFCFSFVMLPDNNLCNVCLQLLLLINILLYYDYTQHWNYSADYAFVLLVLLFDFFVWHG